MEITKDIDEKIDIKIDSWTKKLLDLSKRNKMLYFRETTLSSIEIINPEFSELYKLLVESEKKLNFPQLFEEIEDLDIDNGNNDLSPTSLLGYANSDNDESKFEDIIKGDVETAKDIRTQEKILLNLSKKTRLLKEEQGINALYLCFGFLKWREAKFSNETITSPIILVPIKIEQESILDPFTLRLADDEIVINPTLAFKLENDYNFQFPIIDKDFDIMVYLQEVCDKIAKFDWSVDYKMIISLLSFMKINMYHDIRLNKEKIKKNCIIRAICGDGSGLKHMSDDFNNINYDEDRKVIDTYQVLDADSSQQDAIELSKQGVSFVLQGPPGTGKSQTIANIIAESMSDGKKILFVSEKMAALEVVQRRLEQTGLGDFCLNLHSYKSSKFEVLQSLEKALNASSIKVKDDAYIQMESLENVTHELNEYVYELHEKIMPLGNSIYEVNGFIAKLNDVRNISFEIANVTQISKEDHITIINKINKLKNILSNSKKDIVDNNWYKCIYDGISFELRNDIDNHSRHAIGFLQKTIDKISNLISNVDVFNKFSYAEIDEIASFIELCQQATYLPLKMRDNSVNIEKLLSDTILLKSAYERYHSNINEISLSVNDSIYNENIDTIIENIDNLQTYIDTTFNLTSVKNDYEELISLLLNNLPEMKNNMSKANDLCLKLKRIFEEDNTGFSLKENFSIVKTAKTICNMNKVPKEWFDSDKFIYAEKLLTDASKKQNEYKILYQEILQDYDGNVCDIEYNEILSRYKTKYLKIFGRLSKQYSTDKSIIASFQKDFHARPSKYDVIALLEKIKCINLIKMWFTTESLKFSKLFDNDYINIEYDLGNIQKNIDNFNALKKSYSGIVPTNIMNIITSNKLNEINDIVAKIDQIYSDVFFNQYKDNLRKDNIELLDYVDLEKSLEECYYKISECAKVIKIKNDTQVTTMNIVKFRNVLKLISDDQVFEKEETGKKSMYESIYCDLFTGFSTDWENVIEKLKLYIELTKDSDRCRISSVFLDNLFSKNGIQSELHEYKALLQQLKKDIDIDVEWLKSVYEDKQKISIMSIYGLLDKFIACRDGLDELQDWLDFKKISKEFQEINQADYLIKVIEEKIKPDSLLNIFNLRFYKVWLDNIVPKYSAISNFREVTQNENIKIFAKLDKLQLKVAQARLREKLVLKLPNMELPTVGGDELSILKRELTKQRRIMPIRVLMNSIPLLLPKIKPCIMMSPLSVSMFLQSDNYSFDMVIFDEASQVCTENAVGAIIRGKQLIVAGDSKQLPPSNFFTNAAYDVDDDDYDIVDSVLDELSTVLNERTLKWHYRSKSEELITFSNRKIYKNSLITFPSSCQHMKNIGVEYIYIKDGVYDRGGKRDNIKEAEEIIKLIETHIKERPSMSLGIITFSTQQQNTIESLIRVFRLKNNQYNDFFNDDKEEPFFVKNLENVQGDERDVIIFSICYGKDTNGIFYNNFGPLSKEGGHRRLNVAITRAKRNIKVVGSVLPTDFNLTEKSSDGVKMLKSYVDFAINGTKVLDNEITSSEILELESPFEESVYDFLVSKGYGVVTQVGCSGYRIDMAITRPENHGVFVLGIECDGATYHSSRTARERDRLRQSILESIGWKIHRIWSTDWIKNMAIEKQKLIQVIDNALISRDIAITKEDAIEESAVENLEAIAEENINAVKETSYFDEYISTVFDFYTTFGYDDETKLKTIIEKIVVQEQPIHIEYLGRKVAFLFGNQKVTSKVTNAIEYIVKYKMKECVIIKNNFLYAKNNNTIIPRRPYNDVDKRKIEHIANEEIMEGMLLLISRTYGISKVGLFELLARELGYQRTGSSIAEAFEKAYKELKKKSKIIEVDNKLSIKV